MEAGKWYSSRSAAVMRHVLASRTRLASTRLQKPGGFFDSLNLDGSILRDWRCILLPAMMREAEKQRQYPKVMSKTKDKPSTAAPVIATADKTATEKPEKPMSRYAAFERLSDAQVSFLASIAKGMLAVKSKLGQMDPSDFTQGSIAMTSRGVVVRHEAEKSAKLRTESEKRAVTEIGKARAFLKLAKELGLETQAACLLSTSDLVKFGK